MTDLSTTYLGLKLKNPIVASASPLSKKIDRAKKLDDAGIGAIVMGVVALVAGILILIGK